MEFIVLGVLVISVAFFFYQTTLIKPQEAKVPVYTVEDDVKAIRTIKEIEYWKDFKNGK